VILEGDIERIINVAYILSNSLLCMIQGLLYLMNIGLLDVMLYFDLDAPNMVL
jgi:hypothetical protein